MLCRTKKVWSEASFGAVHRVHTTTAMAEEDNVDWDVMLPVVGACSGLGEYSSCSSAGTMQTRLRLQESARAQPA